MSVNTLTLSTTTPKTGEIIKCSVVPDGSVTITKTEIKWYRSYGELASNAWLEYQDRENVDYLITSVDDWTREIKCVVKVSYTENNTENSPTYTETLSQTTSAVTGVEDVSSKTEITGVTLSTYSPEEGETIIATVQPAGATAVFEWRVGYGWWNSDVNEIVQKTGASFTIPPLDKTVIFKRAYVIVTAKGYGNYYGTKVAVTTNPATTTRKEILFAEGDVTEPAVGEPIKVVILDEDGEEVDSEELDVTWEKKVASDWEIIEAANALSFTPTDDLEGNQLRVTASASESTTYMGETRVILPERVWKPHQDVIPKTDKSLPGPVKTKQDGTRLGLSPARPMVGDEIGFYVTDVHGNVLMREITNHVPIWWRITNNTATVVRNDGGWTYTVTQDDYGDGVHESYIKLQIVMPLSSGLQINHLNRAEFTTRSVRRNESDQDVEPTADSTFGSKLKIDVDKSVVGIGETIVAQILPEGATSQVSWYADGRKVKTESNVSSSSFQILNGSVSKVAAEAVGTGAFGGLLTTSMIATIVAENAEPKTSGEDGGVTAPKKTAHIRGGRGITITPNGDCNHASDATKIAKINWDGVQFKENDETKWFREIAFETPIKGELSEAEDKMTVGSKELHFLVKNNGNATIPKHSFIRINGFEETYSSATEAKNDLEDKEVVLSCNTTGSGQYFAYTQEEIEAGGTGYATFPYAPLVFGVVATSSGSTNLSIGSRLSIETNSSSENALKFIVDTNGLFVVVAFDYESKMVAAFCLASGTSTNIRYCSETSVSNGVLTLTFTTKNVLTNEQL